MSKGQGGKVEGLGGVRCSAWLDITGNPTLEIMGHLPRWGGTDGAYRVMVIDLRKLQQEYGALTVHGVHAARPDSGSKQAAMKSAKSAPGRRTRKRQNNPKGSL